MLRGDGMLSVEAFGERIRSLRIERNLTQQELADRLFVSRKTIGNWESGSCLPDISSLSALAGILGVALMLGLEDYKDKLFPDFGAGKDESTAGQSGSGENKSEEVTGDKDKDV